MPAQERISLRRTHSKTEDGPRSTPRGHRRHASDPFSLSRSFGMPLSDQDMSEFLEAEDLFMSGGSLPSFDVDVALPSPRTPGRKHRRTASEPLMGSVHDFALDLDAAPGHPLLLDDGAPHPLLLGEGGMLDDGMLDSFALDLGDDMDVGAEAPPPPPSEPPPALRGPPRRSGGRAKPNAKPAAKPPKGGGGKPAKGDDDKKTRKYKCSRCGQIKANHVCPYVLQESVAVASQADPTVTVSTMGERTLTAKARVITAA